MALEINEDLTFQKRQWHFQRLGWGVLGLILVLGLLGLLGDGWLSHRKVLQRGVSLEYNYFLRRGKPTVLHIEVVGTSGRTEVSFEHYLEKFRLENVTPEPSQTALSSETYTYSFEGSGAALEFYLLPSHVGKVSGRVSVNGTSIDVRQFVYP
jgi:hypothetical protein